MYARGRTQFVLGLDRYFAPFSPSFLVSFRWLAVDLHLYSNPAGNKPWTWAPWACFTYTQSHLTKSRIPMLFAYGHVCFLFSFCFLFFFAFCLVEDSDSAKENQLAKQRRRRWPLATGQSVSVNVKKGVLLLNKLLLLETQMFLQVSMRMRTKSW